MKRGCSRSFKVNHLDSKGNYSATSNNAKMVHWPLMGGLLHLVQRGRALGGLRQVPSSLYQMYCYDGPLLCGFNVAIKGLRKLVPIESPHATAYKAKSSFVTISAFIRSFININF